LNRYSRKKGSTNLIAGLEECKNLFGKLAQNHTPGNNQIVLITDGNPDNDPSLQSNELKIAHKVKIIGLGVGGGVSLEKLNKVVSPGNAHILKAFTDLDKFFLNQEQPKYTDHHFAVEVLNIAPVVCPREIPGTTPWIFRFHVQNIGKNPLPRGSQLIIRSSEKTSTGMCELTDIVPRGVSIFLDVTVHHTGKLEYDKLPPLLYYYFETSNADSISCDSDNFSLNSAWCLGPFYNIPISELGVDHLNIMVFGVSGSGKSLFICRVFSAFDENNIQTTAAAGGGQDHTTEKICFYPLPENLPIWMWDTWGVTKDNYKNMFELILAGKLPDGYQMKNGINMEDAKDLRNQDNLQSEVHGLLLFVPPGILVNRDLLQQVKDALSVAAAKLQLSPIVVITREDEVDPAERKPLVQKLARELNNIPEGRIHLIKNYTTEQSKDFKLDQSSLHIMREITNNAQAFLKARIGRIANINRYNVPTTNVSPGGMRFGGSSPYQPQIFGQSPQTYGQPQTYGPTQGQSYGQPQAQSYGQPQGQSYGQPQGQSYGQPQAQSYGQPQAQSYGQPQGQSYGQPQAQSYGQHQMQSYGQPQAQSYPQPQAQSYDSGSSSLRIPAKTRGEEFCIEVYLPELSFSCLKMILERDLTDRPNGATTIKKIIKNGKILIRNDNEVRNLKGLGLGLEPDTLEVEW
jgi:hypothetical protein